MNKTGKYLFGPVPSRRLGLSLGVDVVPLKTCTLNCLYCQLGVSASRTLVRGRYVPEGRVLAEIAEFTAGGKDFDYLTFSGSGEPTLHEGLGRMVEEAGRISGRPVAVITNSTTLHIPEVRRDLGRADVVLPSLDAGSKEVFHRLNRPHPRLSLEKIISGLVSFRAGYRGLLWLEIMLVKGINDSPEEMSLIRNAAALCRPDRIHLNTVVRPPVEGEAGPLSREEMAAAAQFFGPRAEVIAEFRREKVAGKKGTKEKSENIVSALRRRPLSMLDLLSVTDLTREEADRALSRMCRDGVVEKKKIGETVYYRVADRRKTG